MGDRMEKQGSNRIWEIDFLRGFSIIMMVWDHLMYDLKSVPA
ncbi:MAG: heparan-alpha-glucosaminide N-acetyltransferase domain-containing protein, partial [bacterium]